jgi:hypothetical protein
MELSKRRIRIGSEAGGVPEELVWQISREQGYFKRINQMS